MFKDVRLINKIFINKIENLDEHITINCDDDIRCKLCGNPLKYFVLKKQYCGYVRVNGCKCSHKVYGNKAYIYSIYGIDDGDIIYENRKKKYKSKKGVPTINYFISKYGKDVGESKYIETYLPSIRQDKQTFIDKYGEDEGNKRYLNFKYKSNNFDKNILIQKYGEDVGTIKYNDIKVKRALKNPRSLIYWKKYSNDESVASLLLSKYQSRGLEFYIKKYGPEEGKLRHNEHYSKIKKSNSYNGYLERFGVVDGHKRYKDACKNKSYTLIKYIEIYGEDRGRQIWEEIVYARVRGQLLHRDALLLYSKISQKLFIGIQSQINDIALFGDNEYYIYDENTYTYKFYDFCLTQRKKIIEFHGDYWHMNPIKYDECVYNSQLHMTAKEKWKYDDDKNLLAKLHGFDVMVVWEYDYNKDPIKVLNECINFING